MLRVSHLPARCSVRRPCAASVAAISLWLLALGGMMARKAMPAAALGAQAGGTAWLISLVVSKTAEQVGHEAVMKQEERVVRD